MSKLVICQNEWFQGETCLNWGSNKVDAKKTGDSVEIPVFFYIFVFVSIN